MSERVLNINESFLREKLAGSAVPLFFKAVTGSSNEDAKHLAGQYEQGLVLALAQQHGRGRRGRRFFSPAGTGLYFSLFFTANMRPEQNRLLPHYAALCTARALRPHFPGIGIKWVNDLLLTGPSGSALKVGGILCESLLGQRPVHIIGIGLNVFPPQDGFPEEIRDKAGALAAEGQDFAAGFWEEIVSRITRGLLLTEDITAAGTLEAYNSLCRTRNRAVRVLFSDQHTADAKALEVLPDGRLMCRGADGRLFCLSNEEVSLLYEPLKAVSQGNE